MNRALYHVQHNHLFGIAWSLYHVHWKSDLIDKNSYIVENGMHPVNRLVSNIKFTIKNKLEEFDNDRYY